MHFGLSGLNKRTIFSQEKRSLFPLMCTPTLDPPELRRRPFPILEPLESDVAPPPRTPIPNPPEERGPFPRTPT